MIIKPEKHTLSDYMNQYIELIDESDLIDALQHIQEHTLDILLHVPSNLENFRYAPEKWSIKQLVLHIIDCERIFSYRALCMARKDQTHFPGFDESLYATFDGSEERNLNEIIIEYKAVRAATIALFKYMNTPYIDNKGTANQTIYTPRILGWMIAGHNFHHTHILKKLYLTNN